jgi:hypothetical protein
MTVAKGMTSTDSVGARSSDYVRFIILSGPRVGSNMLASALNSSPHIVCFRELFNAFSGFIGFHVDGYDNLSAEDRELRNRDFAEFLDRRIFYAHPEGTRAVGFKMPYPHFRFFSGLEEWLVGDGGLRVLHLKRRNLLRMLVSLQIAKATRGWADEQKGTLAGKLTLANAARAARHPLRAAGRLRALLRPQEPRWKSRRAPVVLTAADCREFFAEVQRDSAHYEGIFREHPLLTLYYEDLVEEGSNVFDEAQSFLGVEPGRLAASTRRQNPEPLRELIGNYDELYRAFKHAPERAYFD